MGTSGLAALVAQVPRCFLGQTSRSIAEKKKGKNKEIWSDGREDPVALQSLFNYSDGRCPSALVLCAWFEY